MSCGVTSSRQLWSAITLREEPRTSDHSIGAHAQITTFAQAENQISPIHIQNTSFAIKNPMTTEDAVATIPGSIKLWFKTYLPMRVVPVWSKEMAASNVA